MKRFLCAKPICFLAFLLLILLFFAAGAFARESSSESSPPGKSPSASDTPKYKDASLPIPERVADLLPRMTLEEKVEQLKWDWQRTVGVVDPTGTYTDESARNTVTAEWGPELKLTPRNAAILRNAVQRFQLEKTRLGIPVIFPGEALHGYME